MFIKSQIEFLANFAIFPIIELRKAILIPDDDNESKVGVIGSIGDSALPKSYISSSVAKGLMQMS